MLHYVMRPLELLLFRSLASCIGSLEHSQSPVPPSPALTLSAVVSHIRSPSAATSTHPLPPPGRLLPSFPPGFLVYWTVGSCLLLQPCAYAVYPYSSYVKTCMIVVVAHLPRLPSWGPYYVLTLAEFLIAYNASPDSPLLAGFSASLATCAVAVLTVLTV